MEFKFEVGQKLFVLGAHCGPSYAYRFDPARIYEGVVVRAEITVEDATPGTGKPTPVQRETYTLAVGKERDITLVDVSHLRISEYDLLPNLVVTLNDPLP